jgi:hypothetical protein
MRALAVGALVLLCVPRRAILRLMTLRTVHTSHVVGAGGSYVFKLLTVEALTYASFPIV